MSAVVHVDEGSGAHLTASDVTERGAVLAPAKARREAGIRAAQREQRDKVAAVHAGQLARRAYPDQHGEADAGDELDALSRFRDWATGDLVNGRTFNELRAICAAWKLCGWDIRPTQLTERQIREVLHRGLVPQFKETARGLEAVFSRAKGGAR